MSEYKFSFCGEQCIADHSGALFLPERRLLVVSDLHFEKGSSLARKGVLLPPYDSRETIKRLEIVIKRYDPTRVIALGDSFHDRDAERRLHPLDANRLETLTQRTDWVWILGNHDPIPPARFAGIAETAVQVGQVTFRHEPGASGSKNTAAGSHTMASPGTDGEVIGHFHPCARILVEGRTLRRRGFYGDERRFILPAMGAYTGGLNVLDPAIQGLFAYPMSAKMLALGTQRVFCVGAAHLVADPVPLAQRFA